MFFLKEKLGYELYMGNLNVKKYTFYLFAFFRVRGALSQPA